MREASRPDISCLRRIVIAIGDISAGTRLAPSFADAVRMHTIIDLIEHSSKTGIRVDVPRVPGNSEGYRSWLTSR